MGVSLKNNASTFLAEALSSTAVSCEVEDGTEFPTLGAGEYFYASIQSTDDNIEIVKVTAISGDTLTIVRAQEDTLAIPFAEGARIELRVTRGNLLGTVTPADGDYGDVTVSGTGTAWAIDNGAVTYAKMQDVSGQYKLLGRSSSGSGDVEEIASSADVFTALGSADNGAIRTNIGLGTIATQAASAVAITGGSITGITDLAVADGGTGASDASTARTNLGLGTIATQAASAVAITGGSITGITDLAVADGGTGASTAQTACANVKGPHVLASSAVAVSHTGNTNETVLATVSIPAAALGPNGWARVTSLWSHTNSVNTKTWRLRLNGIAGTQFASIARTTTVTDHDIRIIRNRNSASSQVAFTAAQGVGVGSSTGGVATATQNTANALDLVLTAQLADSGETLTLEAYTIEIYYGA